ncbi:hypothetical protein SAMN02799624_06018 [Paenibacillus sp. UNC496MF]|uniref:hypothetical protein n=1 Tax=Paenibacillus sp. UNC496MF TaxID=1502753 RepID=UPI0008E26AA3|nr:hypothetical protein [Paenibacillus sp. UNC496MF]SFJ80043.1 hypothetical protein SAMN02799624_06018 [Paenibacillus sp. UNC496MF]
MTATNQAMYDVGEYGAAGDGKTLDTNAVREDVQLLVQRRPAVEIAAERTCPALYAKHVKGLRIRGFELEWAGVMPAYCRSGLGIEWFADVTIEGFRGRQPRPDEGAAIVLRDGRGAVVRNSAAAPGSARFLHAERVDGAALYTGNVALEARQAVGPEGHGFAMLGNIERTDEGSEEVSS